MSDEKYTDKYIEDSWSQLFQQENTRDRYLLSMAAGAGALSVTLLGVISAPYVHLWVLLGAWIFLLGGLFFTFTSFLLNIKGLNKAVDLEGKTISKEKNHEIEKLNKQGFRYNIVGFLMVIIALMLLGVFAGINIQGDENGKRNKDRKRKKSTASKTYSCNDKRSTQRHKKCECKRGQSENPEHK